MARGGGLGFELGLGLELRPDLTISYVVISTSKEPGSKICFGGGFAYRP